MEVRNKRCFKNSIHMRIKNVNQYAYANASAMFAKNFLLEYKKKDLGSEKNFFTKILQPIK